jgi:predicted MFS family arabinose efflux permease
VASRITVGAWSDRRSGSQLDVVAGLLATGAIGYALMSLGNAAVVWVAVPITYATGWAFYGSYYLSVIRLNPIAPGAAVGIAQTGAFAGSIAGPLLLGMLARRASFTVAWLTAAAAAALAAVIVAMVQSRTARRQPPPAGG